MVDHRSQGHPASRHEHQARRNDQGPKPSDFIKASGHQRRAEKAGHMTAADQAGPNVKKALPTGPSTYDGEWADLISSRSSADLEPVEQLVHCEKHER